MASTLARCESSGFLAAGTPKIPCVWSSCLQRTSTSPSHCGCLSDYLQLRSIFERMRRSMVRRVEPRIESRGGRTEHLL
jgi:hypothetical protein